MSYQSNIREMVRVQKTLFNNAFDTWGLPLGAVTNDTQAFFEKKPEETIHVKE